MRLLGSGQVDFSDLILSFGDMAQLEQEMARLGAAKPAAAHSDAKAFAGYETAVPVKKKTSLGKIILIAVVCLILLIGLLFLIPAPESLQ